MSSSAPVMVVAGEPSGDRALAAVVRALPSGCEVFGVGGDALARLDVQLVAHVRDVSGMGVAELTGRAPAVVSAVARLLREVVRRRPRLALLASWSAANARIGRVLRKLGVRVAWVSPPEVWAWGRATRAARLRDTADRFIVTLPFEEAIWRAVGADARYLGHPALDHALPTSESRAALRRSLGLDLQTRAIAVLPGSRAAEVERLLVPFVDAVAHLASVSQDARTALGTSPPLVDARVLMAPSLPQKSREFVRTRSRLPLIDAPPGGGAGILGAFDAALVASGTASLEAALAGVPPVVAYRLHPWTLAIARRLVRTRYIALPNVILGRAVFAEAVQELAEAGRLAAFLAKALDDPAQRSACDEVRQAMVGAIPAGLAEIPWGARVAEWVTSELS